MQGIFAGRTQLRYPYGRYGYTRGGGKIWHGGMDLVGSDSTDIRMPYYKNKRITGKVVRARRVTDHSNKTWEWGCTQTYQPHSQVLLLWSVTRRARTTLPVIRLFL